MSEYNPDYNQADEQLKTNEHELTQELASVALQGSEVTQLPVPEQSRGWNEWVDDNPLSKAEADAIRQSVDKNITLTKMYGSTNVHVDSAEK